jgi:hypothetical protein
MESTSNVPKKAMLSSGRRWGSAKTRILTTKSALLAATAALRFAPLRFAPVRFAFARFALPKFAALKFAA